MKFEKLLEIWEENNLLQKDIAKILDISLGTYAMNEEGHDTITLSNLIKFCDYFDVSIDYIFEFNKNKNYDTSLSSFNKEILRTRLKKVRKENKYTQIDIGVLLNIDHSVWCRYELGKTTIPTSFLYIFCKKFNVSADYLLGKTDNPKYLK